MKIEDEIQFSEQRALAPPEMPRDVRNFHMGLANIIQNLCLSGTWRLYEYHMVL